MRYISLISPLYLPYISPISRLYSPQASLRISGAKRIVQEKRERQAGINQARLRAHGGMAQMDALAVTSPISPPYLPISPWR